MFRLKINASKRKLFIIIIFVITLLYLGYLSLYHNTSYGDGFSSSFTNSEFISNKTVMVLAPHQDDEISIAGATIKNLLEAHDQVIVVFATNGDYYRNGATRLTEAINGLKELGVNEKNIIFLGYGDEWNTTYQHIYYSPDNLQIKSHAQRSRTYALKNHVDFRTNQSGYPSIYTRNNYKNDLKDVILKYKPDIILASDLDLHPDHRAMSLLLDEVIDDILKSNIKYTPDIFKAYSYNTSLGSANDFYKLNMESTVLPNKALLNNPNYNLDTPSYNWEDRVRFPVPKEVLTYTKRGNLINSVLEKYKSQKLDKVIIGRVINSDQVFWQRKTTSLTYKAIISVSSGIAKYLNDFKLVDSPNIKLKYMGFSNCVWTPDTNDLKKTLRIDFRTPQDVSYISLYDNFSLSDNILDSTLSFSDGSTVDVSALNKNGSETVVKFPLKKNITYIDFKINKSEGSQPGLCEIEAYDKNINDKPQYIKLMLDNNTNTFIYKYVVTNEDKIPLKLYSYPSNDLNENTGKYKIYIKSRDNNNIELNNDNVIVKNKSIPCKCIIRAELNNNPNIYDEIEIEIPNEEELLQIKAKVNYEKIIDGISTTESNVINKVNNDFTRVFRYIKKKTASL